IAGVHHYRHMTLRGDVELSAKRRELRGEGRMVVVVVEAALAHGDCPGVERGPYRPRMATGHEVHPVVRMDADGPVHEIRKGGRNATRPFRRLDGFADTDERLRAGLTRTGDHALAVGVERRIGEVQVAVDEAAHLVHPVVD